MASPIRFALLAALCLVWLQDRPVLPPFVAPASAAEEPPHDSSADRPGFWMLEPANPRNDDVSACTSLSTDYELRRVESASAGDLNNTSLEDSVAVELSCLPPVDRDATDSDPSPGLMVWIVTHRDAGDVDTAPIATDEAALLTIELLSGVEDGTAQATSVEGDDVGNIAANAEEDRPTTQATDEDDDEEEPVGVDNDNNPPGSGSDEDLHVTAEFSNGGLATYAVQVLNGSALLPEGHYVVTVLLHRGDGARCLHLDGIASSAGNAE